jgi:hypothetical protein
MRTTVDLPDDLHRAVLSIARDSGRSLSQTVSTLVSKALRPGSVADDISVDPVTGFPVVYVGHPVTREMVMTANDDAE